MRIRLIAVLLCAAMLSALFATGALASGEASGAASADGRTVIEVIQTTDIHGYLMDTSSGDESTFQYRLAYIADIVHEARENPAFDDVLLIDGGDTYQGTPVSNLLTGAAMRAALDAMDYDAVVLGNHEFDWGSTEYFADSDGTVPAYELGEFSGDPDIPLLAANLYYADSGERVEFTQDYTIVEKAGFRVAIIGYIPDYTGSVTPALIEPYAFDPGLVRFGARVKEINETERPDITIVAAHEAPAGIAAAMDPDEVDLVTGGHRHAGLYGVADNGIAYIQGGSQGQGYASAAIVIDEAGNVSVEDPMYTGVTGDRTALYDTEENAGKLDVTVLAISHAAWEEVGDEMGEVLGYIDTPVNQTKTGDNGATYAGNWFTGLMLEATRDQGAVAAFYNSGGIRTSFAIPQGEDERIITAGDVYTIAPFCNCLLVYEVTGAELAQQLVNGFISGNYGDQMSGLTFTYESSGTGRNAQITILSITLDDGTEVDINDTETRYRVCMSNYSATLDGSVFVDKEPVFPESEAPIDNIAMIDLLRAEAVANNGYISVDTSPRGIRIGDAPADTGSGEPS